MSASLPPRPSLDHLKKQAKALLKAHRSGDRRSCSSLKQHLPRFALKSDAEILAAEVSLHDAQCVIAREHGFGHWSAMRLAVLTGAEPRREEGRARSVPALRGLDEKLRHHIEALGFSTVGSYRIWCHRQGLYTGLDKSDAQLRQEAEWRREHPPRPAPRPDYRPSQARFITRAYEGDEDIWGGWKRPFEGVDDEGERAALHRLLLHCEKYARIRGPMVPLARCHRDWLRPVEEWFPTSENPEKQLFELTRWLLGREDAGPVVGFRERQGPEAPDRYEEARVRQGGRTVLTPADVASYQELGYVRVPQAFPREAALEIQDFMWSELERMHGFRRDDASTWELPGWKPSQWTRLGLNKTKDHAVYDAISSPRLMGAIEELAGAEAAASKQSWGGFGVIFPKGGGQKWDVGHRWTCYPDPYLDFSGRMGTKTFYSDVRPQGGGPLVAQGSHRLLMSFCERLHSNELRRTLSTLRSRFLRSHPWLTELTGKARGEGDRVRRFMEEATTIDGVEVRVVELTGEPGDAFLCHSGLLRGGNNNCTSAPTFVRG